MVPGDRKGLANYSGSHQHDGAGGNDDHDDYNDIDDHDNGDCNDRDDGDDDGDELVKWNETDSACLAVVSEQLGKLYGTSVMIIYDVMSMIIFDVMSMIIYDVNDHE